MTTAGLAREAASLAPLARRAWAWWTGELAALLPPRLLSARGRSGVVLELERNDASLLLPGRGGSAPARLPLTAGDPVALRARIRAARRHHRSPPDATIRLDPSLVLHASVTLPVQAEAQLRPILSHQIDQLVPLPARDVVFAWRLGPRAPGARMMTVHLVVATRATMDRALATARDAGLAAREVVASETDTAAPLVLWRADRAAAFPAGRRRLLRGLEGLAVAAAIAAFGLYIHRLDTMRATLHDDLAAATRLATATRELSRQLARAADALALLDARTSRPGPLRVLDELTSTIEPPAWVSQLRLRGTTVEITGVAPRATDLITRLEGSALFEQPQFRAPITLSPDGKGERFDLTFGIRATK